MEDRPADLRAPLRRVRGVMAADQVVLADRPVHGQRVLGDVRRQRTVSAVDAGLKRGAFKISRREFNDCWNGDTSRRIARDAKIGSGLL